MGMKYLRLGKLARFEKMRKEELVKLQGGISPRGCSCSCSGVGQNDNTRKAWQSTSSEQLN